MFFKNTFFFVAAELLTSVVYQQYMPTPFALSGKILGVQDEHCRLSEWQPNDILTCNW